MPEKAIRAQLDALGLEYIDLYLIHSPWSLQPAENCWEIQDRSKWSKSDGDKQGSVIWRKTPCVTYFYLFFSSEREDDLQKFRRKHRRQFDWL